MNTKRKKGYRILGKILFALYLCFVFYFLIFSDWYGRTGRMDAYHYNLVLFREIKRFWNYRDQIGLFATFMNLGGNILIFVPFGFFMCLASLKSNMIRTAWYSLLVSLLVEIFQLVTKVGSFDVDDLFLNTLGGILGGIFFVVGKWVRRQYGKRR